MDYAIEFRTLAAESGRNDIALREAFYRGLQDLLKDQLATRDDTTSLLDLLVYTSIHLDNRLRECRREHVSRASDVTSRTPVNHDHPVLLPVCEPSPESMQLGRARLTHEERTHHGTANLCL